MNQVVNERYGFVGHMAGGGGEGLGVWSFADRRGAARVLCPKKGFDVVVAFWRGGGDIANGCCSLGCVGAEYLAAEAFHKLRRRYLRESHTGQFGWGGLHD